MQKALPRLPLREKTLDGFYDWAIIICETNNIIYETLWTVPINHKRPPLIEALM